MLERKGKRVMIDLKIATTKPGVLVTNIGKGPRKLDPLLFFGHKQKPTILLCK